ncbi:hypothetical protein PVAG01_02244 [Phlyctema vagabunda]|uniref:Histone deacetylation protein Rxt3 n=1 Tax=Phlyctema vagabunda TaxID=108571 RepID=A0ABR4PQK0_9HELO
MPPPSSPQQAAQQPSHHTAHAYGQPPARGPPPLSVGTSSNFASNRELPSLLSLGRPPSTGMSINSILREPPREPPPSQYPPPIATTTPAPSAMYAGSTHASPRTSSSNNDYAPFRRPQTPEHQRQYDVHDRRANSAGSPPGASNRSPEARRWGTPQTYTQRPPSDRGMPMGDDRREQPPIRVANPNVPPRPNSQPTAFNPPPSRIPENMRGPPQNEAAFGRREEQNSRPAEQVRPEPSYQRPGFGDRESTVYAYAERERHEREAAMRREQEREQERERERERERALYEHRMRQQQQEHENQLAQRNNQNAQGVHSRPAEVRDQQPIWMRPNYGQGYEHATEQRPPPRPPQTSGYEQSTTTAPQYANHPSYTHVDPRYPPTSQATSAPVQRPGVTATQHDLSNQERHERQRLMMAQQIQNDELLYARSAARSQYPLQESPGRRPLPPQEDPQQGPRFLGIQEINRKGRVSPLPQAVQGAQAQIGTPGGEPGIKSEFGRMFSGIGSGVGAARGVASPVTAGSSGPSPSFSNPGQLRREDLDLVVAQDPPMESNGHQMSRTASRGGSRRRKLKEEDSKGDDEDSNGRQTPSARGKRAKSHHHNHGHGRHHHHHHHRTDEQASSPSQSALTPFKSAKGPNGVPSPTGLESKTAPNLHHHHVPRHHHHHVTPVKASPVNPVEPLPQRVIRSNAVIDSVVHLPRHHLGHEYYQPVLKPSRLNREQSSLRGFTSTPRPLPRFEGSENCTFTVRVSRIHLASASREEITKRKAIWGTDIYTDDSDVVAACIHQGWFRGEWPDDVDVGLLGLELDDGSSGRIQYGDILNEPPRRGPMPVPSNKDLQITILILPALEKYASTTRFGIRSREWGGKHDGYTSIHDGLSFMIQKVRWVDGIDSYEDRDEGRKLKLRPALDEQPKIDGNITENFDRMEGVEESFERDGPGPLDNEIGNMKALGRNWWKKSERKAKAEKKQELVKTPIIKEPERAVVAPPAQQEQRNGSVDVVKVNGSEPLPTKTPPRLFKHRVADMFSREDF